MRCHEARQRLADHGWQIAKSGGDNQLMAHLEKCADCQSLLLAEKAVGEDLEIIRLNQPDIELPLAKVKYSAESASGEHPGLSPARKQSQISHYRPRVKSYQISVAIAVVIIGFLAFVPFNFQEQAGFEIAIAGVDKSIAEDNTEITSLFCALGMEEDKTSALNDSLNVDEIRLNVGECRETCYLTISDLRNEKDVAFVVKKIIELGCCQIDKIVPVFRNESSSLLKHLTKKLLS